MIVIAPKVPVMTIRDSMINIIKMVIIMATVIEIMTMNWIQIFLGSETMDMSIVGKNNWRQKPIR